MAFDVAMSAGSGAPLHNIDCCYFVMIETFFLQVYQAEVEVDHRPSKSMLALNCSMSMTLQQQPPSMSMKSQLSILSTNI